MTQREWRDPLTGEPVMEMAKDGIKGLFDDALAAIYMRKAAEATDDVTADFWRESAIAKMSGQMKRKYFIY